VICHESRFKKDAVNPDSGATGLIQLKEDTSNALGDPNSNEGSHCKAKAAEKGLDWAEMASEYSTADPRLDPEENIMRGVCYLSWIREKNLPALRKKEFEGLSEKEKIQCMLAAYNAGGEPVIKNWMSSGCDPTKINYKETKTYVAEITAWAGIATA